MERDNNFEQCLKCNICSDYCPVAKVNPAFPGPKRLGPDGERYRMLDAAFFDSSMNLCLNCKRCEVSCPLDVHIGDIILKARLKYGGKSHTLRNAALSYTDFMGFWGTHFSPVANAVASLMFKGGPRYASRSFEREFTLSGLAARQSDFSRKVGFFHGCYVNYNNTSLGMDFVKVMNSLGVGVQLLEDEACCGIALISNGFVEKARKNADRNIASVRSFVEKGIPVISTSTTCIFTLREEYQNVLGYDMSALRDSMSTATKYICELFDCSAASLRFKKNLPKIRVAYHMPCHLEKLGWGFYTIVLLRMIPGVELTILDSNCCGVAGTYGFKGENRQISQDVGKPLFDQIRSLGADMVVTDCETCRWQIEMNTGATVIHPVTLLAQSLETLK